MPYASEWGREISTLDKEQLDHIWVSLYILCQWKFFRNEHKEINEIKSMVHHAIDNFDESLWVE